jgi:hypothetical protein
MAGAAGAVCAHDEGRTHSSTCTGVG